MLAVLEDGVRCYLKNMHAVSPRKRNLFFEVREWIHAKDNDGPFSFELLRQEFGLDSSRVRNALEGRHTVAQAAKRRHALATPASSPAFQN
jgi:hypothetical protein